MAAKQKAPDNAGALSFCTELNPAVARAFRERRRKGLKRDPIADCFRIYCFPVSRPYRAKL
jgi:hypothetical protein